MANLPGTRVTGRMSVAVRNPSSRSSRQKNGGQSGAFGSRLTGSALGTLHCSSSQAAHAVHAADHHITFCPHPACSLLRPLLSFLNAAGSVMEGAFCPPRAWYC